MYYTILLKGQRFEYNLERKNVKNINLRIKTDGTIYVSANKSVPQNVIEEFIVSKTDFILNALTKNNVIKPQKQYFGHDEICDVIIDLCRKVYPYFEKRGVKYPQIKFRKMVSRWGSCHMVKGVLTFSTNLMYAPIECVEYVVAHEFTHFLIGNHSKAFYNELSQYMPDWKSRREKLKEVRIK